MNESRSEQVFKHRNLIFDEVHRIVSLLMYYHRQKDEKLPVGMIQRCIELGEITVDEIVERFKDYLLDGLDDD